MGSLLKPLIAKVPQRLLPRCENGPVGIGAECIKSRFIESFPNGTKHIVLNIGDQSADNTPVYRVPEGNYFFYG